MQKIFSYLSLFFLIGSTPVFAYTHQVVLTFVNCTNQKIELNNNASPYKFSLTPSIPARNGYSEPSHLSIPPSSVSNYDMSVYFNSYIDGAMEFHFSGGIKGNAAIHQTQEVRSESCCAFQNCCDTYHNIDMITTTSDTPEVVFLTPTQILDHQIANTNHLVVSLGCNKSPT